MIFLNLKVNPEVIPEQKKDDSTVIQEVNSNEAESVNLNDANEDQILEEYGKAEEKDSLKDDEKELEEAERLIGEI